jgi:hypothetical protein
MARAPSNGAPPHGSEERPPVQEQSTFLQEVLEPDPISDRWIFLLSLGVGAGTGLYTGNWGLAALAWVGAYFAFALVHSALSYFIGCRRLRWFGFFGNIIDLLSILSSF